MKLYYTGESSTIQVREKERMDYRFFRLCLVGIVKKVWRRKIYPHWQQHEVSSVKGFDYLLQSKIIGVPNGNEMDTVSL